jgi:hypothetical protein
MKTFEYKVVKMDISGGFFSRGGKVDTGLLNRLLEELGNEGWELVNTVDTSMGRGSSSSSRDLVLIFKRDK